MTENNAKSESNTKKEGGIGVTIILPIILALIGAAVPIAIAFSGPITTKFFGTATPAPTLAASTPEISLTSPPTTSIQQVPFTETIPASFAPVITAVNFRKDGDIPNRIIYATISFRDNDGDARVVKYELTGTTIRNPSTLKYHDDPIDTPADAQMAGSTVTINWSCAGQGYTVTFNLVIVDKANNESNRFPAKFDCR